MLLTVAAIELFKQPQEIASRQADFAKHNYEGPTVVNLTALPCYPFTTCRAQSRYGNDVSNRVAVEIAGSAFQYLAVLLHFVLFVWACVDTHKRNRPGRGGQEGKLAEGIVADEEKHGLIVGMDGGRGVTGLIAGQGYDQPAQPMPQAAGYQTMQAQPQAWTQQAPQTPPGPVSEKGGRDWR